ncbi:MAG: hypothetical protein IJ515_05065 [Clostridia bacterium]|nr:hypothetical protein [Clostridia bacterium]
MAWRFILAFFICPKATRLSGKDEHGSHWELSAKSILCVLLLGGHIQHRHRFAQNIDWNAIYCESSKDIYPLIKKFVKE